MGYSPKLGRFLSADTIVPGARNPQAYNRYSYVLGNPLKYIDPTGHYCVGDDEDCADEAGDGPAPSGSGGGNNGGGGGGGGGNPHDDDDADPNPLGLPGLPECYPGELVCFLLEDGYEQISTYTYSTTYYSYTNWYESAQGPNGFDINWTVGPLFFMNANLTKGDQTIEWVLDADYRYKMEYTTVTTVTTTTTFDSDGNPESITISEESSTDPTGVYQQALTSLGPLGTFLNTGRNMCGVLLPC